MQRYLETNDRESAREIFSKAWDPLFHQRRESAGSTVPYHELRTQISGDPNILFEDDKRPFSETEIIHEFCREVDLADLERESGEAGGRRAAWLDDRTVSETDYPSQDESTGDKTREYSNPLTASELLQALKVQRFGHQTHPDADRRLIYISKLDPAFVLAIQRTATYIETPALRRGIYNYLVRQMSLQVNVSTREHLAFRLEFSLPYFMLRESSLPETHPWWLRKPAGRLNEAEVSFSLDSTTQLNDHRPFSLVEAHCSVIVQGISNTHWTVYAFVDSCTEDDNDEDFSKAEMYDPQVFIEDPILGNNYNLHRPVLDPRIYFLSVLESRAGRALQEWQSVVRMLERYSKEHELTCVSGRVKKLEWNLSTNAVLGKLIASLSITINAWDRFSAVNGDIAYFKSTVDEEFSENKIDPNRLLNDIQAKFVRLEGLQQILIKLKDLADNNAQALQHRLQRESSEAATKNEVNTSLILHFVAPLAIMTALYMPPIPSISKTYNSLILIVFASLFLIQLTLLFRSKLNVPSHFIGHVFSVLHRSAKSVGSELKVLGKGSYSLRIPPSAHELQNGTRRRLPEDQKKNHHSWICGCGKQIRDEYHQVHRSHSLDQLSRELSYTRAFISDATDANADEVYLPNLDRAVRSFVRSLWKPTGPSLPRHMPRQPSNTQEPLEDGSSTSPGTCLRTLNSAEDHKYVLLCIPFMKQAIKVHQVEVCEVRSDQDFFRLVKSTYRCKRGRHLTAMSLKKVNALHFAKFELYYDDFVNILDLISLPPSDSQEEYDFSPIPPDPMPPVASNSMLHLYENPHHAPPMSRLFKRVPKKLRAKLLSPFGNDQEPVVGWGILIEEGFNWRAFFLYSFLVLIACLGCGLIYSILRGDVQGGFAVAGFLLAFCAFVGGILHTKATS